MNVFGYEFSSSARLQEALTTPSYRMIHPQATDNQRLEFLGDAVLQLLSAEKVFADFSREQEGALSVRRSHMVSTAALCAAAEVHDLVRLLRFNPTIPRPPANAKVYADAVEAIIGAAYLDGGLAGARIIFDALDLAAKERDAVWSTNPKGELQEKTQHLNPPRLPVYQTIATAGRVHEPIFTVRVTVDGVGSADATGGSRQAAEQEAASQLLRNWKPT